MKKPKKTAFAKLLKKQRRANGLSQPQQAEALSVAVGTYRDWEQGRHKPCSTLLRELILINMGLDSQSCQWHLARETKPS